MSTSSVPESRVRLLCDAPERSDGDFVLYWMTGARRPRYNFALQRAAELAQTLEIPLVVFEGLRFDYPWACRRFHKFVIEGMCANRDTFAETPVHYLGYIEKAKNSSKGIIPSLLERAATLVCDEVPQLFLPAMMEKVARRTEIRAESIDSLGLYPALDTERAFTTAASFRRHLQKRLPDFLPEQPMVDPIDEFALARGSSLDLSVDGCLTFDGRSTVDSLLRDLSLDDSIPDAEFEGGHLEGSRLLDGFLRDKLDDYPSDRSHPDKKCQSYLSPYLHFGHTSSFEAFHKICERDDKGPSDFDAPATGSRDGWWGLDAGSEAFLDELVTWRELSINGALHLENYDEFSSLPDWAQKSLRKHQSDEREHTYSLDEFAQSKTHDPLWNAAQNQLRTEGVLQNYMRMLWGKKILEWTESPDQALAVMVELNNRYALDGRDPNSYSGIFWTLGRYDRAWGPERPIYGKVRYMTSDSARRKLRLKEYLATYGDET